MVSGIFGCSSVCFSLHFSFNKVFDTMNRAKDGWQVTPAVWLVVWTWKMMLWLHFEVTAVHTLAIDDSSNMRTVHVQMGGSDCGGREVNTRKFGNCHCNVNKILWKIGFYSQASHIPTTMCNFIVHFLTKNRKPKGLKGPYSPSKILVGTFPFRPFSRVTIMLSFGQLRF